MRRYGLVDIPEIAEDIDAVPISRTITIDGTTFDLSANRSFTTKNIYNTDGTLTGNRTVTMGSYTLSFEKDILVNTLTVGKGSGAGNLTNTAFGNISLTANSSGYANTAIGYRTLRSNTSGISNTGVGSDALNNNTTGQQNTSFGASSMLNNRTGSYNTGIGVQALTTNYSGNYNTAVGLNSQYYNYNGINNTSIGDSSLNLNESGRDNTAIGSASLNNTTSSYNTAIGSATMIYNTTGAYNVAFGYRAGSNTTGINANQTGSNNIFIGYISVGESTTESNRTWIGNTSTTSTWVGGNLLVGIRSNAGYKFDCNGTARIQDNLTISDAKNIILDTTTGTKIGTSTSQKLALWNTTPDVQPTTAITAAAFVANTSGIVDDTATFGGYTIGQIVAALKRIGALA